MQFTKLRLSGFKAFVDPAEFYIEPGLTGIVGPNGCGKSNLVEALQWVMGENSAKRLRGMEMDDVIFNGTSRRPARNVAEVTLHLDNSDRSAIARFNDADTLEIVRRIERGSGSGYRVNGREATARDVRLLFADTATGAKSTSMVSQGQVQAIVDGKPSERRHILEEAAGIAGLDARRNESQNKLNLARNNLQEIGLVIDTLSEELENLRAQAREYERYAGLSNRIKEAEAVLCHLWWIRAEEELRAARAAAVTAEERVAEATMLAQSVQEADAEASDALPALREADVAARAALQKMVTERDLLTAEDQRVAKAAQDLRGRLSQGESDHARTRDQVAEAGECIANLRTEATRLRSDGAQDGARAEAAATAAREAEAALQAREAEHGEITKAIAEGEAQVRDLDRRAGELTKRRARLEDQDRDLERQQETLRQEREALEADTSHKDKAEAAAVALREAEAAQQDAEATKAGTADKASESAEALRAARNQRDRLRSEAQALEAVLQGDRKQDASGARPIVDALTVTEGFEAALAAALPDDLDAPLLETESDVAVTGWRRLDADPEAVSLPEGVEALAPRITGAPAAIDALGKRLRQIGVVADAATARALQPKLKTGQRLVTRDGGMWRWDGFSASGAPSAEAAATRLRQRNRLTALREELATAENALTVVETHYQAIKAQADAAATAEREARNAVRGAFDMATQAQRALAKAEERLTALRSREAPLAENRTRVAGELEDQTNQEKELAEARGALPDLEAARAQAADARDQISTARSALMEARGHLDQARREAEQRRQRLEAIAREIESWSGRSQSAEQHLEELRRRRDDMAGELEELEKRPAQIAVMREALLREIETAEQRCREAADALASAETVARDVKKKLGEAEAALASAREHRATVQGAVRQSENAREMLRERVLDRIEVEPEQALSAVGLDADTVARGNPRPDDIERKVEKLKRDREALGLVNPRAQQDADEVQSKVGAYETDRDDLLEAIDKLEAGIAEIKRQARGKLNEALANLNKHFDMLFKKAFGGGEAHVELTDADDPLTSGLEIYASPPGKKLNRLAPLSGGEKALIAVALLFAAFLTNPSPICVLDEADAPLDDANVDRYCRLLEELARQQSTRFLVVTHHRMTMARMHRLYGVTMMEPGVSRLVSVDLQAPVTAHAAE